MKGREAKLREPPETHDLRTRSSRTFPKKNQLSRCRSYGVGKPNQCGYGFIEQRTAICTEQFSKNGTPFHVTVTHIRFTLQCRKINLN